MVALALLLGQLELGKIDVLNGDLAGTQVRDATIGSHVYLLPEKREYRCIIGSPGYQPRSLLGSGAASIE